MGDAKSRRGVERDKQTRRERGSQKGRRAGNASQRKPTRRSRRARHKQESHLKKGSTKGKKWAEV